MGGQARTTKASRSTRWGAALAALAVTASSLGLVAPAGAADNDKPATVRETKDLAPLPSAAESKPVAEAIKGDFSDPPPHPDQPQSEKRAAKASFDPVRSKPIDAETTPTKKSYENPDGSRTDVLTNTPARYRDANGAWQDFDLTPAPAADGTLRARAHDRSAALAARADGAIILDTTQGPITVRHRGASAAAAKVDGESVTYAGALGRRDLRLVLRADGGFEEFVAVPDAAAGASYVNEITLPAGLSARDGDAGVEIVDGAAKVVATVHNGWATDASAPLPAITPVTVRLLPGVEAVTAPAPTAKTTTVAVEASVDQAWLEDPARAFPVTVDPTYAPTSYFLSQAQAQDTMVYNGIYANTMFGYTPELWVGVDGASLARTYLQFSGLPAPSQNLWVSESHLTLHNTLADCSPTAPPALQVGSPAAAWSEGALTWNTQNSVLPDPSAGTTTPSPACPPGASTVVLDTTWLAWSWVEGILPNNGLVIRDANESTGLPARGRIFSSTQAASGKPMLWITYGYGSSPPAPTASSPADGAVVGTAMPILTINKVTDPDGDPVRYWFRGTPTPDAETGARVIDSGWITPGDPNFPGCPATGATCAYTVPPGALHDGVTYSWHGWSYDGATDWVLGPVRSFTVDLDLGSGDATPRDAVGPAQVNLASGDLVVGVSSPTFAAVGGAVGLTYTYNSAAPSAAAGLTGSYYNDPTGSRSFAGKSPTLVRTDPLVNFEWQYSPPAPSMPIANYLARWEGFVTAPTTGAYRFGTSSDDGVRMWIDNQLVVDRWAQQFSWATPNYAAPIQMTAGTPKAIKIEYFQAGAGALMHLVALGPNDTSNTIRPVVPASWLTHSTGPLPQGWTLAPAGVGAASARLSDRALTVTDASGSAQNFMWSGAGAGFYPTAGGDAVAALDANGLAAVHDGGATVTFDAWGGVATASAATDDGQNTAIVYTWSADVGRRRLLTMLDPHSNRTASLLYGTRNTCPAPPSGYDSPVPTDMLCQVAWWDGTFSNLFYKGGQLARMVDPGGATTDFGYSAAGRLERVRSPLQADAVAASVLTGAADDDSSRTTIAYDTIGRVASVKLAGPLASRPGHSYDYVATRHARVHVEGLTEPAGYARNVTWTEDANSWVVSAGRYVRRTDAATDFTVVETDANGLPASGVMDWGDRPTSGTDRSGRTTTATYDADPALRLTGRPTGLFGAGTTTTRSDTQLKWDGAQTTALRGLAATWWTNTTMAGQPRAHTRSDAPNLVASRPAGMYNFLSARLTGEIALPAGTTQLSLRVAGHARLFVDDTMVVDAWSPHYSPVIVAGTTVTSPGNRHRIRVDYSDASTSVPIVEIYWGPSPGSAVPNSALAPRYANLTSSTSLDSTSGVAARRVDTAYVSPAAALAASTAQDPTGLNLVTAMTYDALGRPLTQTSPGSTTKTLAYYAGVEGPQANTCGAPGVTQAGALRSLTDPDPDGAGPLAARVTQYVYDAVGRPRGSQVVGGGGWSCVTYDARGRVLSQTFPAWDGQATRTVNYNHAVGGNPLVSSIGDPAGTITTTVDLLGRVLSYSDVWGQVTTSTYDTPGRLVTSRGPFGRVDTDNDAGGRVTGQFWTDDPNGAKATTPLATPFYDDSANPGMLARADYANGTNLGSATSFVGRDEAGRPTRLEWSGPAGTLATDEVHYSGPAGSTTSASTASTPMSAPGASAPPGPRTSSTTASGAWSPPASPVTSSATTTPPWWPAAPCSPTPARRPTATGSPTTAPWWPPTATTRPTGWCPPPTPRWGPSPTTPGATPRPWAPKP